MKAIIMKIIHLLIAMICVTALVACTDGSEKLPPIALAVVIGKHANQNEFTQESYSKIEPLVRRAVYDGSISIILADGKPRYIDVLDQDGSRVDFKRDAKNNLVKEDRIKEYTNKVMDFLQSDATRATYPQVDLLAAIKQAELALHDDPISDKHIVIMDTFVSTEGRISLQRMDIDNEGTDLANKLKAQDGILPNLSGISVHWVGFGDVAEPQTLPDTTRPKLEMLWKEIFIACGVVEENIKLYVSPYGTEPNLYSEDEEGFPYVTVVDFVPVTIELDSPNNGDSEESVSEEGLELPDVGFIQDSSEYLNEDEAKYKLKNYADTMIRYLDNHQEASLYIVGTTATTILGGDGSIELSQMRANRLKDTLSELGVPDSRLIALGVGAKVPSHLRTDEFRNGNFDGIIAQANRKAVVYLQDNANFHEILAFNNLDIDALKK